MSIVTVYLGRRWIIALEKSTASDYRLSNIEEATNENSEHINELEKTLTELRKDQLEHYRWMAEREGDTGRAKAFATKLRVLERTTK